MLPLNSGFLWTTDIDSTKSSMFWGANPIFHWKASKNRDRAAEAINLKSSWHHAASLLEEVVKVTLLKHWFGMGSSSWSFWDLSFPFPPWEMFQNIISGNKSNQNFVCVLLNSPFLGVLPPHFFRVEWTLEYKLSLRGAIHWVKLTSGQMKLQMSGVRVFMGFHSKRRGLSSPKQNIAPEVTLLLPAFASSCW